MQDAVLKRDGSFLTGGQEVFVEVGMTLEEVVVLNHAPVGVDQIPKRLENRLVLQACRQGREAAVDRKLAQTGVDPHLGLYGDSRAAIAAAYVETLHLHVLYHPGKIAPVGGQQRVEDLAVGVAQVSAKDRIAEGKGRGALLFPLTIE